MEAHWEGDVYVASRVHPTVNGGRPTIKRLVFDPAADKLTIAQTWGQSSKSFVASFARR